MGFVALAGGNEFRDNCKAMDKSLLEQLEHQPPRVVILPTAAIKGSPRMAAENGVRHFKALGADASAVMVITHEDANDPALFTSLTEADLVYIAGGDPWYLLETLRDTAILLEILAVQGRGGVIAGSSAGAMVLAEKMRTENSIGWIDGLGVVKNVGVLPHHQNADHQFLALMKLPPVCAITKNRTIGRWSGSVASRSIQARVSCVTRQANASACRDQARWTEVPSAVSEIVYPNSISRSRN